jgi:hypothetical protein
MSIPCEVIVKQPGDEGVKSFRPSFPVTGIKATPAKYGIRQLVRLQGDTTPDVFKISYKESGVVVEDGRYDFFLTLLSDSSDPMSKIVGVYSKGVVKFDYDGGGVVNRIGTFKYVLSIINSNDDEEILLTDTFTVRKRP